MKTTTISAADFIDRIHQGLRFHVGERYVVVGEVSLRGAILKQPLLLHGFLFEGPVDFSDTMVPGELDFSDCRFRRTLKINQMLVQGSVRFRRVRIDGEGANLDSSGEVTIEATGLEAEGNLRIEELTCAGGVMAAGLAVGGAAAWSAIDIRHGLDLSGAQLRGHLEMRQCKVGHSLTAIGVKVEGAASFTEVAVGGDLDLSGGQVDGVFQISQSEVSGTGRMQSLTVRSYAFLDRFIVSGDLVLVSARIGEGLFISASGISGILSLDNARMAAMQATRESADVAGSHFGAITAYGLEISLGFQLQGATIGPHPVDPSRAALMLSRMKADHIRFWIATDYWAAIQSTLQDAPEHLADVRAAMLTFVDGDIELDAVRVERTVDLTGLIVIGGVNLADSRVGELYAFSARTMKGSYRAGGAGFLDVAMRGDDIGCVPRRASFTRLNLEACHIGTDVDLTGLGLADGLNAQNAEIGGTIMLADCSGDLPEAHFTCLTRADFSGARIYRLQASGASFMEPLAEDGPLSAGLILDDAEINLLRLFPKEGVGSIYPKPIGVGNLTVRHWKLLDGENEDFRSEAEEAKTFISLLKNDPRISRTTYLSIVSNLRNQGHEAASSKVFRGLSWRTLRLNIRETLSQLSLKRALLLPGQALGWLMTAIYGFLLGFGTAPLRLGAVILGVAIIAYLSLYTLDTNLEQRASRENEAPLYAAATGSAACTDWQKVLVMLRHHVPVALDNDNATCRLRPYGAANFVPPLWPNTSPPVVQSQFSPSDFGGYMRLLALLLWPPFLAFALKRAFRE